MTQSEKINLSFHVEQMEIHSDPESTNSRSKKFRFCAPPATLRKPFHMTVCQGERKAERVPSLFLDVVVSVCVVVALLAVDVASNSDVDSDTGVNADAQPEREHLEREQRQSPNKAHHV